MDNQEFNKLLENLEVPNASNPAHQHKLRAALMNSPVFHEKEPMFSFKKFAAVLAIAAAIIVVGTIYGTHINSTANAQVLLDQAITNVQTLDQSAPAEIPNINNADALQMLHEAKSSRDLSIASEFEAASNPEFAKYTGKITVLQYQNQQGLTVQLYLNNKLPIKKVVFDKTQKNQPPSQIISEDAGSTAQWTVYMDNKNGFTYKYPGDFQMDTKLTPEQLQAVGSYIPVCKDTDNGGLACTYYIGQTYQGTNFEAAGFSVSQLSGMTQDECIGTNFQGGQPTKPVVINGVTFYSDIRGGVGAGHGNQTHTYRTMYNGICYVLSESVSQTNPGVYEGNVNAPKLFIGQDDLFKIMDQISTTFKFTVPNTVSPLPEPISQPVTMQTFTSDYLPVTFQYPSNRSVIWSRADGFALGVVEKAGQNQDTRYSVSFLLESRSEEKIKQDHGPIESMDTYSEITLGGEPAFMYTPKSELVWESDIYVSHNNQIYAIMIDRTDTAFYNSFLQTFKFTR